MQLAIDSYRNQQKIYEQTTYPLEWAQIQEKIGKIYYLLGKHDEDEKFMLEARNYFHSAIKIYETLNAKSALNAAKIILAKINDYL